MPAHGNQRSLWDAGCRFDFANPGLPVASRRCCSTTRRSRATATRCGSCSPSSGSSTRRVEVSVVDRSNRKELLGDLNPACACRRSSSTTAARSASRTRSSGTSPTARSTSRTTRTSARRCCSGSSSSSTATSRTSPSRGSGSRTRGRRSASPIGFPLGWRGATRRSTRWSGTWTAASSSSAKLLDRRHLAVRLHPRRRRRRLRSRAVPRDPCWLGRVAAQPRARRDRRYRVNVRLRFAPSPTGSLHLGNALTAVANRRFADAEAGVLHPAHRRHRSVAHGGGWGGGDPRRPRVARRLVRRRPGSAERTRLELTPRPRDACLAGGAERDKDGSVRLGHDGTTLLRADGTATYQLASVADDLELGITHVIRGNDHRPNLPVQQRIARALGGELPEVIHHGLVLGPDGKKLSKRHGHSSIAELRDEGLPAQAVRAYLDELGLPEHDVQLDLARLRRLAIDAIASMSDDELATAAGAPIELVPALRGARPWSRRREYAHLLLEPEQVRLGEEARATLGRFAELREPAPERLTAEESRALVRELKAVGGDLRSLRLALTGAPTGPSWPRCCLRSRARRHSRGPLAQSAPDYDRRCAPVRHPDPLAGRAAASTRPDPHVLLRVHGVPADPRRELAALRPRDVAAELAAAHGLRREPRPQHHRRRRQGVRRGARAGHLEPGAVGAGHRVVLRGHGRSRTRPARRRAARDRGDRRDRRLHRRAPRARACIRRGRGRLLQRRELARVREALGRPPRRHGRPGVERSEARSARLRAVEVAEVARGRRVGLTVGPGPARLAYRVLGDGREAPRPRVRDPRRGHGPAFPASRERARTIERARPPVRAHLDAQRHARARRGEDVEVAWQRRDAPQCPRCLGSGGVARFPSLGTLEQAGRLLG